MQLRQGPPVQVADRREPGTTAMPPGQAMAAEQALIAEARARARRRRRKVALAVTAAAAALSAAVVLITATVPGKPHKAAAIAPARPAIRTGTIVGHLNACDALSGRLVTPGTVMAVRGTVNWKPMGRGTWHGTVVARAHISDNYHQEFRFALPPGKYVLIGRYDNGSYPGDTVGPVTEVSVIAGKTLRADLNSGCK